MHKNQVYKLEYMHYFYILFTQRNYVFFFIVTENEKGKGTMNM